MPPIRQAAHPPAGVNALANTKTAQEVRQAAERAAAFLAQRDLHSQPASSVNAGNSADTNTSFEFASISEYEASFSARVIDEMVERGQIGPEWRELARTRAIQNVLNRGPLAEARSSLLSTLANSTSGNVGSLGHLDRPRLPAESEIPPRSRLVRGRARRAALPRGGRHANPPRALPVQGPKLEPFDLEKSREGLARCLGAYMDKVMPGVNPSSLSADDTAKLINDMEQMIIEGTGSINGLSAYMNTPGGSSGIPGNSGQDEIRGDELPPLGWKMSKERYIWLVTYMKRYMPLDTPSTISEDERAEHMLLYDQAMPKDSLNVDVPKVKQGKSIAHKPKDNTTHSISEDVNRSDTKTHSADPISAVHKHLPYPPTPYTEEDLSRLARVSYEIAMKKVREAGGSQRAINHGDEGQDECDTDHHHCLISETLHQVLLEQVTGFIGDSQVDTQNTDLLKQESSTPTKPDLTSPGPRTAREAVTRPRGGRGRGRVTGNENHQGQTKRAVNSNHHIVPTSKMAPDASTMTEDKRETLASYMERTKSMRNSSVPRGKKSGKSRQIEDEIRAAVADELPVCTNPHCQCNQSLPLEGSVSEAGSGSGPKLFEPPTSSNGANYGSDSEASSPAPFRETFEKALLATSAFSERVKVTPRSERQTTHMSGVDELLAKAQMLEHDQCPLEAEKSGYDRPAAGGHPPGGPDTPLDNQAAEPDETLTEARKAELDLLVKQYLNCTLEPGRIGDVVGCHYRQSTISSSLKERDRLFHAMDELNAPPPKPACTHKTRPKREKVSACGATNSEIYSGFRAVVAEQFKAPSKTSEDGPGLNLPAFLLPGLYDYVMSQKNDGAPAPKPRRRRVRYKTVVAPIPADLKREINHWETEFKELGIPEENYMKWMTGRYNSYCKGLAKLQQLVTDMKQGPSSPEINHILHAAQGATGVAADTYLLKSDAEPSSSTKTPTRKK